MCDVLQFKDETSNEITQKVVPQVVSHILQGLEGAVITTVKGNTGEQAVPSSAPAPPTAAAPGKGQRT